MQPLTYKHMASEAVDLPIAVWGSWLELRTPKLPDSSLRQCQRGRLGVAVLNLNSEGHYWLARKP